MKLSLSVLIFFWFGLSLFAQRPSDRDLVLGFFEKSVFGPDRDRVLRGIYDSIDESASVRPDRKQGLEHLLFSISLSTPEQAIGRRAAVVERLQKEAQSEFSKKRSRFKKEHPQQSFPRSLERADFSKAQAYQLSPRAFASLERFYSNLGLTLKLPPRNAVSMSDTALLRSLLKVIRWPGLHRSEAGEVSVNLEAWRLAMIDLPPRFRFLLAASRLRLPSVYFQAEELRSALLEKLAWMAYSDPSSAIYFLKMMTINPQTDYSRSVKKETSLAFFLSEAHRWTEAQKREFLTTRMMPNGKKIPLSSSKVLKAFFQKIEEKKEDYQIRFAQFKKDQQLIEGLFGLVKACKS